MATLSRFLYDLKNNKETPFIGFILSLGIFLAACHFISSDSAKLLARNKSAICWPFFENCSSLHIFNPLAANIIYTVLALCSLINAYLFLKKSTSLLPLSLVLFSINLFLYFSIVLSDYRLRLNQHYMFSWLVISFFFSKYKVESHKMILILIYFWAGILKFDHDWLSGYALYKMPYPFNKDSIWLGLYFVIFLEVFLIWGLISKKRKIQFTTLFSLLLFHLISFQVVGYYYPLLMLLLLTVFIKGKRSFDFKVFKEPTFYIIPIIFSSLQLWPKFIPGDSSLTGEGRLLALHMFDAVTECKSHIEFKKKGKVFKVIPLKIKLSPRIQCDPIVYTGIAKAFCKKNQSKISSGLTMKLFFQNKKNYQSEYKTLIDYENFCKNPPKFNIFFPNPWILRT